MVKAARDLEFCICTWSDLVVRCNETILQVEGLPCFVLVYGLIRFILEFALFCKLD